MYLIKHGTVHVGNGTVLEDCDLLLTGTTIAQIGTGLTAPDAQVLDATGRHIFPGFIDPTSSIGAMGIHTAYPDINERSNSVTPEMNIKYSADPDEIDRQEFYKSGITCVGLAPGNTNVIGGQMAVYKTAPMRMQDRLVREQVGLKCCVSGSVTRTFGKSDKLPMTRMGIFHLLEQSLRDATETPAEKLTDGQKVVAKALRREMPFFIGAQQESEINAILHLFQGKDVTINLVDGYGFGGVSESLIEQGVGLVLGNISDLSRITKHGMDLSILAKMAARGSCIAFTNTSGGGSEGREILLWTAIDVYRAGVPAEEVVKMLTLNPARMLGLESRIGSLEPGKDADLSIYTGHPITSYAARVERSIVNGEVVL